MSASALTTEAERKKFCDDYARWLEDGGMRNAPRAQLLAIRAAMFNFPAVSRQLGRAPMPSGEPAR